MSGSDDMNFDPEAEADHEKAMTEVSEETIRELAKRLYTYAGTSVLYSPIGFEEILRRHLQPETEKGPIEQAIDKVLDEAFSGVTLNGFSAWFRDEWKDALGEAVIVPFEGRTKDTRAVKLDPQTMEQLSDGFLSAHVDMADGEYDSSDVLDLFYRHVVIQPGVTEEQLEALRAIFQRWYCREWYLEGLDNSELPDPDRLAAAVVQAARDAFHVVQPAAQPEPKEEGLPPLITATRLANDNVFFSIGRQAITRNLVAALDRALGGDYWRQR